MSFNKQYIEPRVAYDSGRASKNKGLMRVSPYYENEKADKYWYAGYDGVEFDEIK